MKRKRSPTRPRIEYRSEQYYNKNSYRRSPSPTRKKRKLYDDRKNSPIRNHNPRNTQSDIEELRNTFLPPVRTFSKSIVTDGRRKNYSSGEVPKFVSSSNYSSSFTGQGELPKKKSKKFVWKKNKRRLSSSTQREIQLELTKIQEQKEKKELEKRLCEEGREDVERIRNYMRRKENTKVSESEEHLFLETQETQRRSLRIKSGKFEIPDIFLQKLMDNTKFSILPWKILKFLSLEELNGFEENINRSMFLFSNEVNDNFLIPFLFLISTEKKKKNLMELLITNDENYNNKENLRDEGIHESVKEEIKKTLVGKNLEDLKSMESEIHEKLDSQKKAIEKEEEEEEDLYDPEYWQGLLKLLKIRKSKVSILEYNNKYFKDEVKQVEHELTLDEIFSNKIVFYKKQIDENKIIDSLDIFKNNSNSKNDSDSSNKLVLANPGSCNLLENNEVFNSLSELERKKYSGKIEILRKKKEEERFFKVISHFVGMDDKDHVEEVPIVETRFNKKFGNECIKPLFFNKIFYGYEWTKYNKVHFNEKNLPPRTVQKYRFNIFYPEIQSEENYVGNSKINNSNHYLMNKKKRYPRFWFDRSQTTDEHTVLIFHIGKPYLDVAFKIVNREWEMAERKGYRSSFDRGIFQLYFSMKRTRRRRFNTR